VSDPSPGWTFRPVPPNPRSIVDLIRAGLLDAGLAATLWRLVEGRVPLIVAAEGDGAVRTTLLEALLDTLPPGLRRSELRGNDETFDWLPQATELGWSGRPHQRGGVVVRPDDTILVAAELSDRLPAFTWGERARVAVRATAIGYGLATTMPGDSLEDVLEALARPPVSLTDDELSFLGCVVVVRRIDGQRHRVVAAHYLRPTVRDAHGHTQRLGPAVLATWDPGRDRFEEFGWGILPELAFRLGIRPGDLERDLDRRRELLQALAQDGVVDTAEVRTALHGYLAASA
jgi:hypothetical protein